MMGRSEPGCATREGMGIDPQFFPAGGRCRMPPLPAAWSAAASPPACWCPPGNWLRTGWGSPAGFDGSAGGERKKARETFKTPVQELPTHPMTAGRPEGPSIPPCPPPWDGKGERITCCCPCSRCCSWSRSWLGAVGGLLSVCRGCMAMLVGKAPRGGGTWTGMVPKDGFCLTMPGKAPGRLAVGEAEE